MSTPKNIVTLTKGNERYVFVFDDSDIDPLLAKVAEFAADPELFFNWIDAAMVSRRIRELAK